jgi:hypothetical protein
MASNSQVPLMLSNFEPQQTIKIWLIIIIVTSSLLYAKLFTWLMLRVGSTKKLDSTLNTTSPQPHLQKMLPCRHPCHTWHFKLGTMCEVVSPNFHAFKLHIWTSSDLGLRATLHTRLKPPWPLRRLSKFTPQ